MPNVNGTSGLRTLLMETIEGVKDGTIEPRRAQAIGALTGKILQSAKLDLEVLKLSGKVDEIGNKQFGVQLLEMSKK